MKINVGTLCLTTCLMFAVTANAQQGGGGGGGRNGRGGGMFGRNTVFSVVGNDAVQKELALTTDDAAKVKAVTDDFTAAIREGMAGGGFRNMSTEERAKLAEKNAETAKTFLPKLKATLTPDQFTRLQQITWQTQGSAAFSDPELVKALTITKDQQDKIKTVTDDYGAKTRELFAANAGGGGGGGGGGNANRDKMRELGQERDTQVNAVLTKDQLDKFASLKGKEFDVSQIQGGFGGGGGNGGGGNGGGNGARAKRPQTKAE